MKGRTVLAALLFGLLAGAASAESRFPVTHIDYYGYADWDDLAKPSTTVLKGVAELKANRSSNAYPIFRDAWLKNPNDALAVHGLFLSARAERKLGEAAELVHGQILKARAKSESIPQAELFTIFYLGALSTYFNLEEGDKTCPLPNSDSHWLYFRLAQDELRPVDLVSRGQRYLYVNAQYALKHYGISRQAARTLLAKDPRFGHLKLLLARSYSGGFIARKVGGRPAQVPLDERDNPERWAKLSAEVCREHPELEVAKYEAGIAYMAIDREKGTAFLKQFLSSEPPTTARYQYAQQVLSGKRPKS